MKVYYIICLVLIGLALLSVILILICACCCYMPLLMSREGGRGNFRFGGDDSPMTNEEVERVRRETAAAEEEERVRKEIEIAVEAELVR